MRGYFLIDLFAPRSSAQFCENCNFTMKLYTTEAPFFTLTPGGVNVSAEYGMIRIDTESSTRDSQEALVLNAATTASAKAEIVKVVSPDRSSMPQRASR